MASMTRLLPFQRSPKLQARARRAEGLGWRLRRAPHRRLLQAPTPAQSTQVWPTELSLTAAVMGVSCGGPAGQQVGRRAAPVVHVFPGRLIPLRPRRVLPLAAVRPPLRLGRQCLAPLQARCTCRHRGRWRLRVGTGTGQGPRPCSLAGARRHRPARPPGACRCHEPTAASAAVGGPGHAHGAAGCRAR
jgi:hypothetical protein